MPSDRYARVKEIYLRVLDVPETERETYLDSACDGDPTLISEVQALLGYAADPRSPEAVAGEFAESLAEASPAAMPERVGRYRLLELIGHGGMGAVYRAEQDAPRRVVAVKLLRDAWVSESSRKRFEREAELLGRLQHPGIARVYEASTGEDGQLPFIAMELVEGLTINAWLEAESPDLERRLRLLAEIAEAVQHAHHQGVVHRDLKPGNVLVDAAGRPKVLDFGIARVVDDALRAETLRTSTGELVGTLSYMSPEQAGGDPAAIDTRSDVYSLGVLAYEMLTGRPPYSLRGVSLPEAVKTILDAAPSRPRSHRPSLPTDVEAIVLKALARDKEERYQSADALASDIHRFLRREPIDAHPPSAWYPVRMFVRRHRGLVAGVAAVFVVLVGGLVSTFVQAERARDAAHRERTERRRAEKLAESERQQRGRAERLARQESEARELAERATYLAQIHAIEAALNAGDTKEARRLLEATQASRRGWEWRHYAARLDTSGRRLGISRSLTPSLAFLADGHLATLTRDGELQLRMPPAFDVVARRPLGAGVTSFDISSDGRTLVTAHDDGRLCLWGEGDQPRFVRERRRGKQRPVEAVHLEPGGTRCLLQIGSDVSLWSPEEGRVRRLHSSSSYCRWSPDGAWVLAGQLERLDPEKRRRLQPLDLRSMLGRDDLGGRVEKISTAAFDAAGERLAVGTVNPSLHLCDLDSARRYRFIRGKRKPIRAAVWLPNGQRVITGDELGNLQIWEEASGRMVRELLGHDGRITSLAVDAEGRFVAAATDGSVRIWDLAHEELANDRWHRRPITGVAWSPDGTFLATGGRDGLYLWNAQGRGDPLTLIEGFAKAPRGLAWSKDGNRLHVASPELATLDVAQGEVIARYGAKDERARGKVAADLAWPGRLDYGRGVSPDGRLYVVSPRKRDAELSLVRVEDGSVVARTRNPGLLFGTAFSPDGRLLAAAYGGGLVRIHEVEGLRTVVDLRRHSGGAMAVAFTPDGTRLASGGKDGTIRLWDTGTWAETAVMRAHSGDVQALDFSPDGTRLASGSHDRSFRVWSSVPRRVLLDRARKGRGEGR